MKIKNAVLSIALAAAALSIAVLATGNEASAVPSAKAEPTPYSADHSRIEYKAGSSSEQPPTF